MVAVPTRPFVATVIAEPLARSAWIRLVGDVDIGVEPALAGAVDRLSRSRHDVVVIDLTAVTFACSTFANFVADLHAAIPDAALILHNPSRMVRRVLLITGLDAVVTMPADTSRSIRPGAVRSRGGI